MPLYVADALEADERAALRGHLAAGCAACAGHLAEAQATFAAVSLGLDPVTPSPDLLQRVFDRIDREESPRQGAASPWGWIPAAAAAAVVAAAVTFAAVTRHDRAALADARLTYNGDARAALLRSALEDRDQTVEQLRRRLAVQQQLVDALRSPEARVIDLAGAGQPRASARLVWAPSGNRSVLLASNLTPQPAGRTYELWFITADQRKVPAGTFAVDPAGSATVPVPIPPGLAPLAVAAVTDEPAGGTAAPTGNIQLAGKVQ
jgi:anti-sigma-K factor RskA